MIKIAYNISNLSDARFFASHGFDWIIFAPPIIDFEQIEKLKEIINWLEGVKFGIKINNLEDYNKINQFNIQLHGFLCPKAFNFNKINTENAVIFTFTMESDVIDHSNKVTQIFQSQHSLTFRGILDLSYFTPSQMNIKISQLEGIALKGGYEEKIGLKSFEIYEDWLEILEN